MIAQWVHRATPTVVATVIAVGGVTAVMKILEPGGGPALPAVAGTAPPSPSLTGSRHSLTPTAAARTVAPSSPAASGPVLVAQVQPPVTVTSPAGRTPEPHGTSPVPSRTPVPVHSPAPTPVPSPTRTPAPSPSPTAVTPTSVPVTTPPAQPTCTAVVTVLGVTVCADLAIGG